MAPTGLREKQRQAARTAMLDAALDAFLDSGYLGTTIVDVAVEAGVSERTVYNHFETKAGLLLALINEHIGAGLQHAAADDRAASATTLHDALTAAGESLRAVVEHALPLFRVAREAAVVDEEVADRLAAQEAFRFEDQGRLVDVLAERGLVRTDVTVDWLKRAYWLLAGPDTAMRAIDAGWSVDDYIRWVRDSAIGAMAPADTDA